MCCAKAVNADFIIGPSRRHNNSGHILQRCFAGYLHGLVA